MLRSRPVVFVIAVLCAALLASAIGYSAYIRDRTQLDEFGVYAAFLARLSHDLPPSMFALADTTSRLTAPTPADTWIPKELRPYPPEKAAPPDQFVDFCGSWCGREFMKRNLRAWTLSTHSEVHFPFDILPQSSEISTGERGKRIVTVTRPGFDFWHHRAVLMYSFDYGLGSQSGDVLLEKINGKWQVHSYTGFLL